MAQVNVKDLDIVLGGNNILKSMNLEVQDGEFLVLLGPSGCGKSTLLHSIAGFIDATEGQILIGDKDVTWADPKDRDIGMVFQSYALYPTMNVERNMSFGLRVARVPKAEIKSRVERAASMLHLTDLLKRRPSQLSGGQRQRVAIGRALVRDAKVFLFDEPLSNLDAKLRSELRRELKQLHQQLETTMIYVTHDQVEAMTLATRIAVMKAGVIQQIGSPDEIYNYPTNLFVAGFLGAPTMNTFRGKLVKDNGQTTFVGPAFMANLSSYPNAKNIQTSEVIVGFRPENINLTDGKTSANGNSGRISLIEPLGPQNIVWLTLADGSTLSAVTDTQWHGKVGETISFDFDSARASVFDAKTEQRV